MYIFCIDTHLCKSSHGQISTFYNTFKTVGGHDVVNNNHVVKESFLSFVKLITYARSIMIKPFSSSTA